MKLGTLKALFFCGGALIGSAVTYIFCKKMEKDKIDKIVGEYEAEIKSMQTEIVADDIPDETVKAPAEDPTKMKYDENKDDYSKYYTVKGYKYPLIKNEAYEASVAKDACPTDGKSSKPESITSYAYAENKWGYIQESLLYYVDDDVLVYEDGHSYDETGESEDGDFLDYEPIANKDKLVGDTNLELFELCDTETIWVRNDQEQRLYEIELMHGNCPIHDWD